MDLGRGAAVATSDKKKENFSFFLNLTYFFIGWGRGPLSPSLDKRKKEKFWFFYF